MIDKRLFLFTDVLVTQVVFENGKGKADLPIIMGKEVGVEVFLIMQQMKCFARI